MLSVWPTRVNILISRLGWLKVISTFAKLDRFISTGRLVGEMMKHLYRISDI